MAIFHWYKKNLMKAVHIIALIHSRNINYPVLIGDNKSKWWGSYSCQNESMLSVGHKVLYEGLYSSIYVIV